MEAQQNQFFGRERILRDIVRGILAPKPASFSLVGSKLSGKSAIITHLASIDGPLRSPSYADWRLPPFDNAGQVVVSTIDCDWQEAQENLLLHVYTVLVQQLQHQERIELPWQEIDQQPALGRRLWSIARHLSQMGYRLVILFDNFDSVFARQLLSMEAVDELRPLTMEMAMVVATEQPLHDLDRNLAASPLFNVMTQIFIGLIESEATHSWIDSYTSTYPFVNEIKDSLMEITGGHPYLLRRLEDILAEANQMMPRGSDPAHDLSPFIRLRLAEYGRLLFTTLWRTLENPPSPMRVDGVIHLLERLTKAPVAIDQIGRDYFSTANWLINQAVLRVTTDGYQIFTPLFSEFVAAQLAAKASESQGARGSTQIGEASIYRRLTKIETALLRYFEENSHRVVSAEQLLTEVWKRPDASTRRVQEAIRRLRLQLEEEYPPHGVIENDRGRGYRFVPADQ